MLDWITNPTTALLISTATLILGGLTLWIVLGQLRIMNRQLAIMERQHKLLEAQLAQRSQLSVEADSDLPSKRLEFYVKNSGNKGAHDFYWHLYLPSSLCASRNLIGNNQFPIEADRSLSMNGIQYYHYGDQVTSVVYPGRRIPLAALSVANPSLKETHEILWQVISEDGKFPSESEFGNLAVSVSAMS